MKIETLDIYSKNFSPQKSFYQDKLNLPIKEISSEKFEVNIGFSTLRIRKAKESKPYHIALHISAKMEEKALAWLKNKLKVLSFKNDEIIDFPNWNAKSIYFYDADRNIIEFISRKDFNHSESSEFSENEIVGIAEIGLAVKDVKSTFHYIRNHSTLLQYFGDQEKFCVIGTDNGLIILVDQNSKTWFPTKDKSENADFEMKFSHSKENYQLKYSDSELLLQRIL